MNDRRIVENGYCRNLTEAQADRLRGARLVYDHGHGICCFTHAHMEACVYDLKRAIDYVENILKGRRE